VKKIFIVLLIVLFIGGLTADVSADRGSIPFLPQVEIYEPLQQAVIAWDGQEQILILSTDLYASEPTKVLEVLPLPAEPEVKEADPEIFHRAHRLYYEKLYQQFTFLRGEMTRGETTEIPQAGEVTFQDKIGAYDINVTRVLKPEAFVDWVNNYLTQQGVENPTIPEEMGEVIEEYIEEGFDWFVFSVVELDSEPHSQEAIQYRFESDGAYFPLKITRTEAGETELEIMAFMPPARPDYSHVSSLNFLPTRFAVGVNRKEISEVDEEMGELMKTHENSALHHWRIAGKLSEFTEDFYITLPEIDEENIAYFRDIPFIDLEVHPDYREVASLAESVIDDENISLAEEPAEREGKIVDTRLLEQATFYTAFLDNYLLFDAVTNSFLDNYDFLLNQEVKVRGYIGELEMTADELARQDRDLFFTLIYLDQAEEDIYSFPVIYVTEIEGYNKYCGEQLYFEHYEAVHDDFSPFLFGGSECFWHSSLE